MTHLTTDAARTQKRHWYAAGFLFIAAFINLLDTTIVNLALPAIQTEFGATDTAMQWVLVIYVLAFAAGLLPFGRFGDAIGRRKLFLCGIVGFVTTSLVCGVAPNMETLIVARLLKGMCAAIMLPQVLAIIHATFPNDLKGKAIGYFGMVSGLGALAGPLIGGPLIAADLFGLGWRMIFLINLPLGVISFVGVSAYVSRDLKTRKQSSDWFGAGLFATGSVALLYPLIEGRSSGWPLELLALFFVSVLLFAVFWQRQKKLATNNEMQLVPVKLLSNGRFLSGLIITNCLFIGVAGPIVVLAITLQSGLGFSAAEAGLVLAAHPLAAMFTSLATGQMSPRYLQWRILFGFVALLVGMISLRGIVPFSGGPLTLWGPLFLIGAGVGSANVALFQSVLRTVEPSDAGAGSGALQALQQIGIAVSIAIVGQIFFSSLTQENNAEHYVAALQKSLLLPIAIYAGLTFATLRTLIKEDSKHDA
ncbi:MAG: MFS transporter [Pelagimonas sp.]|uniref:MFS transporter n=1 Tax=Pelagimonas sp. TaxID=2073170 RepID=UPI003D6A942A